MKCSKCGETCMGIRKGAVLDEMPLELPVSNCCEEKIIYEGVENIHESEWEPLEIECIPTDFWVNDRYEIEVGYGNGYDLIDFGKLEVINRLLGVHQGVFRFKLKQAEPFNNGDWIKVTPIDGSACIIGQVDSIAEERVTLWMSKSWYLKDDCSKLTDEQIKFLELEIMKWSE